MVRSIPSLRSADSHPFGAREIVPPDLLQAGHRYRVATHGLQYPNDSIDTVPAVDGDVTVGIDFGSTEGDLAGFFLTSGPVTVSTGRYEWHASGPDGGFSAIAPASTRRL